VVLEQQSGGQVDGGAVTSGINQLTQAAFVLNKNEVLTHHPMEQFEKMSTVITISNFHFT